MQSHGQSANRRQDTARERYACSMFSTISVLALTAGLIGILVSASWQFLLR